VCAVESVVKPPATALPCNSYPLNLQRIVCDRQTDRQTNLMLNE